MNRRSCLLKALLRKIVRFLLISQVFVFFVSGHDVMAEDLFIYCGAGLRQPVDEILSEYMNKTGEKVIVEFGGSGQLLTRYRATGRGDLFLPGSDYYTDRLSEEGATASIYPLVLHVPVVAVNRKSEDKIKTFGDLARPGVRVGLGDPKAMALGRIAAAVLEKSGLKDAILENTVIYSGTVKQLTLYASMGNVDAAIIARADAIQNKDKLVYFEINSEWYTPEVVTVAVFKTSQNIDRANRLAEYFSRPESIKIFVRYGFIPAE